MRNTIIFGLLMLSLGVMVTLAVLSPSGDSTGIHTIEAKLPAGFGKLVEVEGRLLEEPDETKARFGFAILEIDWIDNEKLNKPIAITVMPSTAALALTKSSSGQASVGEAAVPEVGDWVRFRGYEAGQFGGLPREVYGPVALDEALIPASAMFHFLHVFTIAGVLEPQHDDTSQ